MEVVSPLSSLSPVSRGLLLMLTKSRHLILDPLLQEIDLSHLLWSILKYSTFTHQQTWGVSPVVLRSIPQQAGVTKDWEHGCRSE